MNQPTNTHTHTLGVLTDEDDQQQAGGVQLDVGVAEGVAEGGVDDHEEDGTADGAERRLPPLQTLPEETTTHLHTHTHTEERFITPHSDMSYFCLTHTHTPT